jgi:small GTP-binding protein
MNQEKLQNAFRNADKNSGNVYVSGDNISDSDFVAVFSHLPRSRQVRALELAGSRIGDGGVEALARAAKRFPKLTALRLDDTQVGNIGVEAISRAAKAKSFPKLQSLSLGGTRAGNEGVESLARAAEARGFPVLRSLWLARTQAGNEGVESLARAAEARGFPKLETLGLGETQVGDEGVESLALAAEARGFSNLLTLVLGATPVGNDGVEALARAAEAHGFPKLRALELRSTHVGNKGVEALARAADAQGFPQLQVLGLQGTPISVAWEELAAGDPQRIFLALKGAAIAEAKVVVLGEPGVGKSWLCRRLFLDEIPTIRHETHDIELMHPIWKPRVGDLEVNLRVWDFGGQHVLHGTHEMFLTQRSTAILVLDVTRSMQDNRAEYWRKLLDYCAGSDTPTIVVVSKCDEEFPLTMHRVGQINPAKLQYGLAHAPQVVQSFSALTPLPPRPGGSISAPIAALRSAITVALEQIEDVHKKISLETAQMKTCVERRIRDRALVSLDEYQEWCHDEKVDDSGQSILRILHNFGSVFFFGHTERERQLKLDKTWLGGLPPGEQRLVSAPRDSILSKWIVNPHWLKWPIYEVVRQSADAQRTPRGVMAFHEIESFATQGAMDKGLEMPLFDGPTYVCKVLQLTGLCWEQEHNVYLFPRGLANGNPYGCDQWTSRRLWEWGFFPEDSFHRFVVRMHEREEVVKDGEGAWQHWRNAVVIEHPPGCRAVILAKPAAGRIEVRLDPTSPQSADFSNLCEFVRDLFENEIVKRPVAAKQLRGAAELEKKQLLETSDEMSTVESASESATYSPLEFAAPIAIYNAIKSVISPPSATSKAKGLPNYNNMTTWEVRNNHKKGKGRLLHIDDIMDRFSDFYHKHEGVELDPEDKELIVGLILGKERKKLG